MAKATLQAVRGMNDMLPEQGDAWAFVEALLRKVCRQYHYQEIRFPILEKTALFKRAVGEVTDIVEKEMYTFEDRNGDSLSLRPEGTAACVRACLEHGLLHNQTQRLWYMGPMYRHERPQKGRYRQFYQFGVEVFGMISAAIEVEIILLSHRIWQALGIEQKVSLQINTLGSTESRNAYREKLFAYYQAHQDQLDEDSQRRLSTNPLRILDSKNPAMIELNQNAPKLLDHLDEADRAHFQQVCDLLQAAGIAYEINPKLVRGLDYYNRTVFEWVTDLLGAQGTICAGGRYDGLVSMLGGNDTPAVGFAIGIERLILLLDEAKIPAQHPDLYFVLANEAAQQAGLVIAETIRNQFPDLNVELNLTGAGFKSQFKKADKSGAHYAVVIGEEELNNNQVILKDLRQGADQQVLSTAQLLDELEKL